MKFLYLVQSLRHDSGSAGAKKVLDASKNDTKANFQENIPGKILFQKKWGASPPGHPFVGGLLFILFLFFEFLQLSQVKCKTGLIVALIKL